MTIASDVKAAEVHPSVQPTAKPISVPPPTGPLPTDFPGAVILANQGILTYKDLSAFAPDYRITGIDTDTAALIAAGIAEEPPTGDAAKFCLTRDHVVDAVAVTATNDDGTDEHVDIYLANGQVFRRAHGPVNNPTQPGEFALGQADS